MLHCQECYSNVDVIDVVANENGAYERYRCVSCGKLGSMTVGYQTAIKRYTGCLVKQGSDKVAY